MLKIRIIFIRFPSLSTHTTQNLHYTVSKKELQALSAEYKRWILVNLIKSGVPALAANNQAAGIVENTVVLYGADKSHNHKFRDSVEDVVTVFNKFTDGWDEDIEKYWQELDFDVIENDCGGVGADALRKNKQIGTGSHGNQNCTYPHEVIGLYRTPPAGTHGSGPTGQATLKYKNMFPIGTKMAAKVGIPFAQPGYTEGKPREKYRRSEFAQRIHPDNVWESMTLALLIGDNMSCKTHADFDNCCLQHHVMTVSRVRLARDNRGKLVLRRATFIFYNKKASQDFLIKVDKLFIPIMETKRFRGSLTLHRSGMGEWRQAWCDALGTEGAALHHTNAKAPNLTNSTAYGAAFTMECGMAKDDLYLFNFAFQFMRMLQEGVEMNNIDGAQIATHVAWANSPFSLCSLLNEMGSEGKLPEIDYKG